MATYYWVGGSGNWNATSTTNWATSSGGTGGAGVPTLDDDVIFDAGSNVGTGAFTVTVTGTSVAPAVCRDFTASGLDGALTFTMGATARLFVYGSLTLPSTNFTWSGTFGARVDFKSTSIGKTIITNGVSLTQTIVAIDGVGGEWTLGSALTTGNTLIIQNGSFKTSGFNITTTDVAMLALTTRAIDLSSSQVTISGSNGWNAATVTNLTFNAGTSSIIFTAPSPTFNGGGLTFYNVSFTSTSAGTATITGANTFNDLTFTSLAATGIRNISIGANQTVTGTLTLGTANTAIRRMFMRSDVVGTPRTITATTMATIADVDFRDINNAGTTWSGTRLGNCGGNTGITFDAPKTVYRVGTGNWSATQWSLSSGGSVDINNFPLAQDTVLFDTGTTTGTHTTDQAWNIGTLDMSALNVAVTFACTLAPSVYGNITLNNNVTTSGAGTFTFAGESNQTITSSGRAFTQILAINKPVGTSLILADNLTTTSTASNLSFLFPQGNLNLNNNIFTCAFFGSASGTRSIDFGTGKIVVTGNNTGVLSLANLTGFSYTGTPRFELTYAGAVGTRTIDIGRAGGATESNVVDVYITAGSDIIDMRNIGQSHFRTLDFTGFTGSTSANQTLFAYGNLTYSSGMTVTAGTSITFLKSNGTQTITTNGKTIDFPVTKQAAGTLQLADNLTLGTTRTLTHTAGTIDLNDFDLTTGLYSSTGSTTRQLDFGTGDLNVEGASFTASGSNFTTAGTGSISMNSASSKTFAGGGFTYPTLNQGGTGTLTITGANTFANISNTVQPCTITFPAGQITSVQNFTASGTAGNLVTLNSSTLGTQWTLAKV